MILQNFSFVKKNEFSEEEENLRDRIRELETRNKELEKLAAMAKEERRTYNYGKSSSLSA